MFGPNLKAAFQISPPKIGKFLSSRWRGSKFQILLLSFVWKVNWLSQKTLRRVSFFDTEGSWNVWAKPESSFPNQPPQNWSISLEHASRVQISNFIGFFVWKLSSLNESFAQGFFLWHWRVAECVGQNWKQLSKSAPQKLVNFFRAGEEGPNFKFYCFLLSER